MSTENRYNYYDILEIGPQATQHEILLAYEKAKRTYSPQNISLYSIFSKQEAESLRHMIEEAYKVLGNQTYRNIYEKRIQAKTYTDYELSFDSIQQSLKVDLVQNLNEKNTPPLKATALPNQEEVFEKNEDFESEIKTQQEWSGEFLQKVREYKKVSIDHLHEKTKVNPWYLKALENMDPKNLPAPVFVRGYIIQMAKSLGLNEKAVAESYMKIYKNKLGN
jgi:Helix-turn-helix domain/DnaJ domain